MVTQILCGNKKTIESVTSSPGHFNACYVELLGQGFTAEDMAVKKLAQARLLAGDANDLWQRGRWSTNGLVYLSNADADILVTAPRYTPFLRYVVKAVAAHFAGKESYVGDELKELMDNAKEDAADAVKSGVLLLKRKGLKQNIESRAFGDVPMTYFLFEEFAKPYGVALADKRIDAVNLILVDENYARQQNRPFSRALWALNLCNYAALLGNNYVSLLSYYGGRVSGVRELSEPEVAERSNRQRP